LNSHGRIYTDASGPIYYNEFGAYTQIQKKLIDDRLKLTGSVRYDKSKNFEGNLSPRLSAVYAAGSQKTIRLEAHSKQVLETQLRKINILVLMLEQLFY